MIVTCRNTVGESSAKIFADVDEPIRNATIVNKYIYVRVNQTFDFLLTWSGSRVRYCVIGENNSCNARDVVIRNVTMAIIKHVFLTAGKYSIVVRLWNSVSSRHVGARRPLTVENPVQGVQLFSLGPSRCLSQSIAFYLNLSTDVSPPSNASAFFNFGDGSSRFFQKVDFTTKIFLKKHRYLHPGLYNVSVNVTNHVSHRLLTVIAHVKRSPLQGINVTYKNGSSFQPGLGSRHQYFPAGKTVRFALRQDRDDVGFEWKLGNESLKETRKANVEHVFFFPGCYNITAIIKSATLQENCFRYICIEKEIVDIAWSVEQPTYFKDPTVFTFSAGMEDILPCFLLSLGDNTTVSFGDVSCGFTFRNLTTYAHQYKAQGIYTVRLLAWNHVSSIQRSIQVAISEEACPDPVVRIVGGGPKSRPLIVRNVQEVVLQPVITQKCVVARTVIIHWEVFAVNYGNSGDKEWRRTRRLRSARREMLILRNSTYANIRKERFTMLLQSLPTELLKVKLSVSFNGTDRDLSHVKGFNYTWLEVTRSPLLARIKGKVK